MWHTLIDNQKRYGDGNGYGGGNGNGYGDGNGNGNGGGYRNGYGYGYGNGYGNGYGGGYRNGYGGGNGENDAPTPDCLITYLAWVGLVRDGSEESERVTHVAHAD